VDDEAVPGAPQIIWRRIGTHDVVSDLSPSSGRPCRGFGTRREQPRFFVHRRDGRLNCRKPLYEAKSSAAAETGLKPRADWIFQPRSQKVARPVHPPESR